MSQLHNLIKEFNIETDDDKKTEKFIAGLKNQLRHLRHDLGWSSSRTNAVYKRGVGSPWYKKDNGKVSFVVKLGREYVKIDPNQKTAKTKMIIENEEKLEEFFRKLIVLAEAGELTDVLEQVSTNDEDSQADE